MGQGKYQAAPALGYINKAVTGWQFAFLLQQYFSFAVTPGVRVNQLTLQPFVTKLLPHSCYVQTQPTITLDFVKGTSSVPVNLVVGKLFAGRWNVNLQGTAYPRWTSPPSKDYELRLSIGYQFPVFFSKPWSSRRPFAPARVRRLGEQPLPLPRQVSVAVQAPRMNQRHGAARSVEIGARRHA